jgi:hypothetical protein
MRRGSMPLWSSVGFGLERYTLTLLFTAALVARTLVVAFRFWRGMSRWRLGLVVATGEVFAISELSLYAARLGGSLSVGLLLMELEQPR